MLVGPDVFSGDGRIDWAKVKSSGHSFAFCKATEGKDFVDPSFHTNQSEMRKAGVPVRGFYHFARPQPFRKGSTEATHFVQTVGRVEPGEILVLDLEGHKYRTRKQLETFVADFVSTVRAKRPRVPVVIYTGSWWRDHIDGSSNHGCPLWLAAYTSSPNNYVPRSWHDWTFWQFTESGRCEGVPVACDLSYYHGSEKELRALSGHPAPTRKPTKPKSRPKKPKFPGTLKRGAKGDKVKTWQQRLTSLGQKVNEDGVFGTRTERSTKAFQKKRGLVQDGVVGRRTWAAAWK